MLVLDTLPGRRAPSYTGKQEKVVTLIWGNFCPNWTPGAEAIPGVA
jgi:hypothetical protein